MEQKELNRYRSQIQLAMQHAAKGELDAAGRIYDEVTSIEHNSGILHSELGHLATLFSAIDKAIRHFQDALEIEPDNSDFKSFLGLSILKAGGRSEARELFESALSIDANCIPARYGLGIFAMDEGEHSEARDYLEAIFKERSKDINLCINLAKVYANLAEHETSIEYLRKALKINPSDSLALSTLGEILADTGQKDAAEKHYESMIRNNNNAGRAYISLARLRNFSEQDQAFINRAEKALEQGMPPEDRFAIHFALGKIYDDCKKFDSAFTHFKQANLLQKGDYHRKNDKQWGKVIRKTFTAATISKLSNNGHSSAIPVFVIGMPRSGTTLLERVIASHSEADGAGELLTIPEILHSLIDEKNSRSGIKVVQNLSSKELQEKAEQYLKVLTLNKQGAKKIVDKLPGNYQNVGFITSLFPNATLINIQRNPLDTCLSCYFQAFRGVRWSNDFDDIAHSYHLYQNYISHWKSILPEGKILDVSYEALIENPEDESRRILAHCGLEWEADILQFHDKEAIVKTASHWQVRQPIYKSSKMRWKNYAPHISDLANHLKKYLEEDKVALAEHGIELPKSKRFGLF